MIELTVNGKAQKVDADPATPLLYVLRDDLQLNGAKFGCGLGQCGACTVMIDGEAHFSCVTPVSSAAGQADQDGRGARHGRQSRPLQRAFIEEQAAQCGYCIAGMMMRAQALLEQNPAASEAEIRAGTVAQSLPLRHAHAHPARGETRRRRHARRRRRPANRGSSR